MLGKRRRKGVYAIGRREGRVSGRESEWVRDEREWGRKGGTEREADKENSMGERVNVWQLVTKKTEYGTDN